MITLFNISLNQLQWSLIMSTQDKYYMHENTH